jgi:hypothetical protein
MTAINAPPDDTIQRMAQKKCALWQIVRVQNIDGFRCCDGSLLQIETERLQVVASHGLLRKLA